MIRIVFVLIAAPFVFLAVLVYVAVGVIDDFVERRHAKARRR